VRILKHSDHESWFYPITFDGFSGIGYGTVMADRPSSSQGRNSQPEPSDQRNHYRQQG